MKKILCLGVFILSTTFVFAAENKMVELPTPKKSGGMPVFQVLAERESNREFSGKELTLQQMSDLLWSGFGVNRENGKRTAPSALNYQEVSLYAVTEKGIYLYNAQENKLVEIASGDFRAKTGSQEYVKTASANILFVADTSKYSSNDRNAIEWASISAGAICQNIYLYCTSEKLSCVVRKSFDAKELTALLKLKSSQQVILAQSVGYPKETK